MNSVDKNTYIIIGIILSCFYILMGILVVKRIHNDIGEICIIKKWDINFFNNNSDLLYLFSSILLLCYLGLKSRLFVIIFMLLGLSVPFEEKIEFLFPIEIIIFNILVTNAYLWSQIYI